MIFRLATGTTILLEEFPDKKSAVAWATEEIKMFDADSYQVYQLVAEMEADDQPRKVKIKDIK